MSCEIAIKVSNVDKCYQLYAEPKDRLKQFLWRGRKQFYKEFWALKNINFEIKKGEVIGIIGRNGAGKSTLLQLVCGTLTPSQGEVTVNGRIAALLELGAGFNPDFTGRENVFMNASIMGMTHAKIAERFDEIVDFSGIREFIDQPVKTYSSGMYVRLAFSVAINVEPDILIIDEALSVGDGAFAKKSFNSIMKLRDEGKTILFCSHSLYHIEAICNKAIWLNQGSIKQIGKPSSVISAYDLFLACQNSDSSAPNTFTAHTNYENIGTTRISKVECRANEKLATVLILDSLKTTLSIKIFFISDINLPTPSVAIAIIKKDGTLVCSAGSKNDNFTLSQSSDGSGHGLLIIPKIPLLKGDYYINVFLACEHALHIYDHAEHVAELSISQLGLEQGIVSLPHLWESSV